VTGGFTEFRQLFVPDFFILSETLPHARYLFDDFSDLDTWILPHYIVSSLKNI